jgi:hypothetical protein
MPQSTDLVKEVVEVRRLKAGERNVTVLVWVHTLRPSAKSTTNGIDQDSLPGSDGGREAKGTPAILLQTCPRLA